MNFRTAIMKYLTDNITDERFFHYFREICNIPHVSFHTDKIRDYIEYFVQKSIANGIDIIRIFDCLNDIRNLQTAVTACNREKGHAQVALSYTLGDAYTLDYWKDMAKRIEDMGAKSLCIKDMAGLLVPVKATELVEALKESVDIPIDLHTHYTSGVASMTYMKAVEAGCDIIDTAISPFSMGTSQPATEVMVEAFKGTEFDTGLDQNLLAEIADYFRPMREEALESGLMNTKLTIRIAFFIVSFFSYLIFSDKNFTM